MRPPTGNQCIPTPELRQLYGTETGSCYVPFIAGGWTRSAAHGRLNSFELTATLVTSPRLHLRPEDLRRILQAGVDPAQSHRHTADPVVVQAPRIAAIIWPLAHSPNIPIRAHSAGRGSNHRPQATPDRSRDDMSGGSELPRYLTESHGPRFARN